ncbi:MAG: L-seryl-tRNA(Sec) selenium transferase [Myxococcales bacterium]|nr:L-seryl-tRNA(Sec) selenium transferase [Myxococcales bacterium]
MSASTSRFARLPKVDRVLAASPLREHPAAASLKKLLVQEAVESLRARLRDDDAHALPSVEALARELAEALDERWLRPHPRPVINATGVILHTNLGRAPLSAAARDAMVAAAGYCDLEFERASGRRGSRFTPLRPLGRALLEAEDVHVVNNGGAAVLLACTALGLPGGVVLSRGQMIEIGDRFRVAEMAAAAGARVREVGSTNRTHLHDYERALTGDDPPSAILWAHLSNFRQEGFVASVALHELAALARARGVPLIADLGSGSLGRGIPGDEPTIQEYLRAGADVVTCSGDKLLGGPQAGIMAGRAALIERCRRHPMARALRPDKCTLAALHATLAAHARGGDDVALPLQRMAAASVESLRARARQLGRALGWPEDQLEFRATRAAIGGGSLPGATLDSVALVLPRPGALEAGALARRLRLGEPPVVTRVQGGEVLVDLRAVEPADDEALIQALRAALPG